MNEVVTGFSAGSAASLTNACLLPLYPGLIAFLAGTSGDERTRRVSALLGIPVLAGVLTMMTAAGLVVVLFNAAFASILPVLLPVMYGLVIFMGILLLAGKNPFARLQTLEMPVFKNPFVTAYLYGLLLGPMTLPCTGPVLVAAFTFSAGIEDVVSGLVYFLAFGLGFGWILVVLPLLALPIQRRAVNWLTAQQNLLNALSGLLLIAIGIFGLLSDVVPHLDPAFDLGNTGQTLYWIATFGLALIVGIVLYRRTAAEKTKA